MSMKKQLIDLIIDAKRLDPKCGSFTEYLADHLIANGVTICATDKNDGCKWIPVTERLPENNIKVLVYCKDKTIQGGKVRHTGSYDNGFWFLSRQPDIQSFPFLEWEVTHWMPLPEPPKGE